MMLTTLVLAALLQATAPTQPLTFDRPESRTAGPALTVSSTTFAPGGTMALANSGYGKNHSPSVSWSKGPERTKSYVLIVEDADASLDGSRPLLHWLAYDIPAGFTEVKNRTRNVAHIAAPAGRHRGSALPSEPSEDAPAVEGPLTLSQGLNDHGGLGWTGPHPPVGAPAHHYHFQVFALDRTAAAYPGATFDKVLKDMGGHVLAKGQMIGLYAQAPDKVRKVKDADGKLVEASPAT